LKRALFWLVPTLLVVGLVVWRFKSRGAVEAQAAQQQQGKKKGATVAVTPAVARTIVQTIQSVGDVESPYKVEISPKTAGRIEYLNVREGDAVKIGDLLLRIDPSDLQGAVLQQEAALAEARSRLAQASMVQGSTDVGISSQIQQQKAGLGSQKANLNQVTQSLEGQIAAAEAQVRVAQSALDNAQASLLKENASLKNAQTKLDRTNGLYKQGYVAAQDMDDASTAYDVQKQAVEVAKGQVASAKSLLDVQEQNLKITRHKGVADIAAAKALVTQGEASVRVADANRSQSPAYRQNLAALQSQVDAAAGQLQQARSRLADTVVKSTIDGTITARKSDPGALASPGTPVLEIQSVDWLYVSATIPVEVAASIHEGQTAKITIDSLPGRVFTGPITNINSAADPVNRQFGVKVRLNNPDHSLRPGMYARLAIVTGQVQAKVVVPKEAITTTDDGTRTVAVLTGDKVSVRKVKLGATDEKGSEVLQGVEPGEQVVVLSFNVLKDGQSVTLSNPSDKGPK